MKKETEDKIVSWFLAMTDFLPEGTVKNNLKLKKNFQDNLGINVQESGEENSFLFAALAVYFLESEGVINNVSENGVSLNFNK